MHTDDRTRDGAKQALLVTTEPNPQVHEK